MKQTENTQPIHLDVVSDIVCPWCVIGYLQLEKAAKTIDTSFSLVWHPFELNPHMPAAGQNLHEHIADKYGSTAAQSDEIRSRITEMGAGLGFTFNFDENSRMFNTFRAHQLMAWSLGEGLQQDLAMALFTAYFTDQQDIHDVDILASVAESVGLNHSAALAVLNDERFAEGVREEERVWTSQGIQSVPSMIFDRQHLVSGAQGVESYESILQQLMATRAA